MDGQIVNPKTDTENILSYFTTMVLLRGLGISLVALILFASILLPVTEALPRIVAKCTACKCLARELQKRIDNERPRNHLDMRHRLDKHGKRYGKVIDYKISELRAVELLDDLCEELSAYSILSFQIRNPVSTSGPKTTRQWLRVKDPADDQVNGTRPKDHIERVKVKKLQLWCGAVMEEKEEDIERAIVSGVFEERAVDEFLCKETIKVCPDKSLPTDWIDEPELEARIAAEKAMTTSNDKSSSNKETSAGEAGNIDASSDVNTSPGTKDEL